MSADAEDLKNTLTQAGWSEVSINYAPMDCGQSHAVGVQARRSDGCWRRYGVRGKASIPRSLLMRELARAVSESWLNARL